MSEAGKRFQRLARRLAGRGRGRRSPVGRQPPAGDEEPARHDSWSFPSPSTEESRARAETEPAGEPERERAQGAELGNEPGADAAREGRRAVIARRLRSIRRRPADPEAETGTGAGRRISFDRLAGPASVARARLTRVAAATGAGARRVGSGTSRQWFRLPLALRQRIAAVAALLAVAALVFFVVLPLSPCWVPGGDRCPPSDEAIGLVPAGVTAYVHANVDTETDQYEAAADVLGRLPNLAGMATGLLSQAADREIDYDRDIRAWSAGELALVADTDGAEIARMLMFEVADTDGAIAFSRRVLGAGSSTSELDGVSIESDADGLSAAIDEGFLLLGPDELVRSSITLDPGDSLAVDRIARDGMETLPDDALVEAFLSADLVSSLANRRELSQFDTFVNSDASQGVVISVGFDERGADLAVRSLQDEQRAETEPDFFSALPLYEPELTEQVGGDALVYLGVGDPGESAATLVGQAAETAPDLFSGLQAFGRRLRGQGGIDIERDLLPLLEGEAALTVEPQVPAGEQDEEEESGLIGEIGVPYLALLATGVDAETALRELAELQVPIAEAVDPAGGQAPVFDSREIEGVDAQSLRLSPVVDLTYAAFDEEFVIGTSPAAVERTLGEGEPLADAENFEEATRNLPDRVSMLLYLDFRDLLALGERLFLAEDPDYARIATDARTLRAAAIAVTRTRAELATDLRVTVGEPEPPAVESEAFDPGAG